MKINENHSPFFRIRRTLIVLRWLLGLPLQIKTDSYTEFKFVKWLECLRLMLLINLHLLYFLSWVFILLMNDGNLKKFAEVMQESNNSYSSNLIDIAFCMSWPISVIILSCAYTLMFHYNSKKLSTFCQETVEIRANVSKLLNNNKRKKARFSFKMVENSKKLVVYGQLLNLITSFLFGLWNYNIFSTSSESSVFKQYGLSYQILLPPLIVIQSLFTVYSPISCTVEVIICQMVDVVADIFKDWRSLLLYQTVVQPSKFHPHEIQNICPNSFEGDDK